MYFFSLSLTRLERRGHTHTLLLYHMSNTGGVTNLFEALTWTIHAHLQHVEKERATISEATETKPKDHVLVCSEAALDRCVNSNQGGAVFIFPVGGHRAGKMKTAQP